MLNIFIPMANMKQGVLNGIMQQNQKKRSSLGQSNHQIAQHRAAKQKKRHSLHKETSKSA